MLQCNFLRPQVISEVLCHRIFLLESDQTTLTVDKITNSHILSYVQQCLILKSHGFQESIKKVVISVDKYNFLTLVKISKSAGFKTLYSQSWRPDKSQTPFNIPVTQGCYTSHCTLDV